MTALAKIKVSVECRDAVRAPVATISASASGRARSRSSSIADRRRRSAFELCAPVDAVDPEVRLGSSGGPTSGIRSPASSARCRSSGARSTRRSWRCSSRRRSRSASRSSSPSSCPAWLRQPLVFLTELLAAIPSIVYGLWGIFVLVPAVRAARDVARRSRCGSCRCSAGRRSASACWRRR